VTLSVAEVYDSNIVGAEPGAITQSQAEDNSGVYSRFSSGLFYSTNRRSVHFVASGGVNLDYYPRFRSDVRNPLDSYNGSSGVSINVGAHTLRAAQSISRQPYFAFALQPVLNPAAALIPNDVNHVNLTPEVALLSEPMILYNTTASLSSPINRRTSMDVTYGFNGSRASERWPTVRGHAVDVRLNRSVTRTLQVNGRYNFTAAKYESVFLGATDLQAHDAEGGITYNKPLSRTRTVRLAASAGRSMLRSESPLDGRSEPVNGLATSGELTLQFARSWSASAAFRRSLLLLQGLTEPYYGNSASFGVRGEPTRRLTLATETSVVRGDTASIVRAAAYNTLTTSALVTYALTRTLGLSTSFHHSEYDFAPTAQLPAGVSRVLNRDVVSVALTFGAPLIGRPVAP
jgi:hypothetical protein